MELRENDIVLRTWNINDTDCILKWWNDGSVMAHAGFPLGLGKTREEIENTITTPSNKERMIIEIHGNKVGELCYEPLDDTTCEIGIKICESTYQNQGYGTEVLTILLNYLFRELKLDTVVLDTMLENVRAQHVYEKLGFVRVGVRENCWKDQMGVLRSAVDYELNRDVWERRE